MVDVPPIKRAKRPANLRRREDTENDGDVVDSSKDPGGFVGLHRSSESPVLVSSNFVYDKISGWRLEAREQSDVCEVLNAPARKSRHGDSTRVKVGV